MIYRIDVVKSYDTIQVSQIYRDSLSVGSLGIYREIKEDSKEAASLFTHPLLQILFHFESG